MPNMNQYGLYNGGSDAWKDAFDIEILDRHWLQRDIIRI